MTYGQTGSVMRQAASWMVSAVLMVVGAIVLVAVPDNAPRANAATYTANSYDWGDCSFRQAGNGGATQQQANSLCWIDWSGVKLPTNSTQRIPVTRTIGRYTLSFTLSRPQVYGGTFGLADLTDQKTTLSAHPASTTSNVAFGGPVGSSSAFWPYSGDTSLSVIQSQHADGAQENNLMRLALSDIKLVDEKGKPVPGFSLTMTDAEATTTNEGLSMNSGTAQDGDAKSVRYTPSGWRQGCDYQNGYGVQSSTMIYGKNRGPADYVCSSTADRLPVASALATETAPTDLTVSAWTNGNQAFALAVNLGRVGGSVTADTAFEQLQTGQATTFDLTAKSTAGPVIPLPADGTMTDYVRPTGADGIAPTDSVAFTSKASGAQTDRTFQRYNPEWTCTAGTSASVTIKAGAVPAGYTLQNDQAAGTSTVTTANSANAPLDCDVAWVPKFKASTVNLSKFVEGTASGFPEVQNRRYSLDYTCTLASFAQAYSAEPLSGSVVIDRNSTRQLLTLPRGANCTFTESFPAMSDPNNSGSTTTEPALPGKSLTLTWGPDPKVTGTYDSFDKSNTLKSKQVTLGETNSITATNRFDYRGGTVDISKTIVGDPVPELANTTRAYDFTWGCTATNRSGSFQITVKYAADGTASGKAPTLTDVPVARDCWIKAVTNLSTEEATRITSLPRSVTPTGDVQNVPVADPSDPNTYHFKLSDYQEPAGEAASVITSPNASHALLTVKHPYEYKTADLKVAKRLTGPGAAVARAEFGTTTTFPVRYKCTYGVSGVMEGTLDITRDRESPATVPNVPLGAACRVWEDTAGVPQGKDVRYVERNPDGTAATMVQAADPDDVTTALDNDAAKTTPVHTMHSPSTDSSNLVEIQNRYEPRLATVALKKLVDTGGVFGSLPDSFYFTFTCGPRPVELADGSITSVPISGTAQISGGEVVGLVATSGDDTTRPLLNDGPNGTVRVPYGAECSFSEDLPKLPGGVTMTSDAADASLEVDSPAETATVTNTFGAAGAGLTLSQTFGGPTPGLAPSGGITYDVQCTNGFKKSYTLTRSAPRVQIPAASVPAGTDCKITESPVDDGTRTANGETYAIGRAAYATMPAEGSAPAVNDTFGALTSAPVGMSLTVTVGNTSVLSLAAEYDYLYEQVETEKVVTFDPATEQWISDARKAVKRDRVFSIDLECTTPLGATINSRVDVTARDTSLAGTTKAFGSVPKGSSCVATELSSTMAAGVILDTSAQFNGAEDGDGSTGPESVRFTVGSGQNLVTMTNDYRRKLVDLHLNKIAGLPQSVDESIRDLYGNEFNEHLHRHSFTLDCRDPLAEDAPLGTHLTGAIQGEGSYTFNGVPAGTSCHIVGDEFTQLDLADDSTGQHLESHFRTRDVEWVVDGSASTSYVDREVGDGVTESNYFDVPGDGSAHTVDLVNNYEFVMTSIRRSKQIVATKEGFDLLAAADPLYSFTFQCSGVGYGDWTATSGQSWPNQVSYSRFPGAPVLDPNTGQLTHTVTSAELEVPAGALCTGTEVDATKTPAQLQLTKKHQNPAGETVAGATLTARAPGGSEPGEDNYTFVNEYTRRMVPVRLSMLQDGYLKGADPTGYTMDVVCTDPAKTGKTVTYRLSDASSVATVSDSGAPSTGDIVNLPAGADCKLTVNGSALNARPEVNVTQGDRRPYMQFGLWTGDRAAAANPKVPPITLSPDQVTPQMKTYEYTFSVAADAAVKEGEDVAMTVAAEAAHPQARASVSMTKESLGAIADGASYSFTSDCLPGKTITLKAGESVTLPKAPVDSTCTFTEVDDSVANIEPVLGVKEHGRHLEISSVVNQNGRPATQTQEAAPGQHAVSTMIRPVDSATDLSSGGTVGDEWSLVLTNTYPSVDVEKSIAGGWTLDPNSSVLHPEATDFEVTYTTTNNGGFPLTEFTIKDPSLAGRTLTREGKPDYVVPDDGTIDPAFCDQGGGTSLVAGAAATCTFRASIAEPPPTLVKVDGGPVTVSATAGTGPATQHVSDKDSFSTMRPVVGTLPAAGVSTLVIVVLIGLAVVTYGLLRQRRDDAAEKASSGGDGHTA